jgi:hypothetical protein
VLGKPLFNLRLDIEHCAHVVYVNGGLVQQNLGQGPVHAEIPVNHWLRSGENVIEVHMFKWQGEPDECDVKLTLSWRDASWPRDEPSLTLLRCVHDSKNAPREDPARGSSPAGVFDSQTGRAVDSGDLRVGVASVVALPGRWAQDHILSRRFELALPFQQWAFLRGERHTLEWEVEDESQQRPVYVALLAAYQRLYDLLAKGDIEAFLDACEERSSETDAAYYKVPGETRARLRQLLVKAMNSPQLELATLDVEPDESWTFTVGSQGTVVGLTQGDRASSILRYQAKDETPFSMVFPVWFRKERAGYVVTR